MAKAKQERCLETTVQGIVNRNAQLRKLIEDGHTSNDRVRDLVIAQVGYDPLLEEKCRELEAAMAGNKGELVLIAYSGERRTKHIFGQGWETEPEDFYRMGLLSGEALLGDTTRAGLPFKMLSVPTLCYVGGPVHRYGYFGPLKQSDVCKGPILEWGHDFDSRPPSLVEILIGEHGWKSTLHIGDKAVKAWLEEQRMGELLPHALEALGRLVLTPTPA